MFGSLEIVGHMDTIEEETESQTTTPRGDDKSLTEQQQVSRLPKIILNPIAYITLATVAVGGYQGWKHNLHKKAWATARYYGGKIGSYLSKLANAKLPAEFKC